MIFFSCITLHADIHFIDVYMLVSQLLTIIAKPLEFRVSSEAFFRFVKLTTRQYAKKTVRFCHPLLLLHSSISKRKRGVLYCTCKIIYNAIQELITIIKQNQRSRIIRDHHQAVNEYVPDYQSFFHSIISIIKIVKKSDEVI